MMRQQRSQETTGETSWVRESEGARFEQRAVIDFLQVPTRFR